MHSSTLLAIESSCDETSAAVIKNGLLLSNVIASQTVHENYGGVVPELASRAHQQHIVPVIHQALAKANISKSELTAIAFTKGPGLLGALLVGSSFAKSLSMALGIPLIGVNHMQAHILAHFIEAEKPEFPFLCLTVSGGHTQIVLVKDYLDMEIVGQTRDDAVGEAFDKSAKLLGLAYPGGPLIDKFAQTGDANAFSFPTTSIPGFDYSFSGIKTAILYFLKDKLNKNPNFIQEYKEDISASIQKTLISMLLEKLEAAAKHFKIDQIAIAGGVSANTGLRNQLKEMGDKNNWDIYIPKFEYCTDNAAMIAITGYFMEKAGLFEAIDVSPDPRMKF